MIDYCDKKSLTLSISTSSVS